MLIKLGIGDAARAAFEFPLSRSGHAPDAPAFSLLRRGPSSSTSSPCPLPSPPSSRASSSGASRSSRQRRGLVAVAVRGASSHSPALPCA